MIKSQETVKLHAQLKGQNPVAKKSKYAHKIISALQIKARSDHGPETLQLMSEVVGQPCDGMPANNRKKRSFHTTVMTLKTPCDRSSSGKTECL